MQFVSDASAMSDMETRSSVQDVYTRFPVRSAIVLYVEEGGLCGAMGIEGRECAPRPAQERPGNVLPARNHGQRKPSTTNSGSGHQWEGRVADGGDGGDRGRYACR